jgi:hypothetical protein
LKLGGAISKVTSRLQLCDEMSELRRLLGWDSVILAREWCDFESAGESTYGSIPQEIRVWIVDRRPYAWSFHYLNAVLRPIGFPPSDSDLQRLAELADRIGSAFDSRLVVADFAKDKAGRWIFIEAGPGSCVGTAHEAVFKAVAGKLVGLSSPFIADDCSGLFADRRSED